MASLSLREAAEQAGSSKSTIWRAIKSGRMSVTRLDDGGFAIDPAELFRVFQPERPSKGLRDLLAEVKREPGRAAPGSGRMARAGRAASDRSAPAVVASADGVSFRFSRAHRGACSSSTKLPVEGIWITQPVWILHKCLTQNSDGSNLDFWRPNAHCGEGHAIRPFADVSPPWSGLAAQRHLTRARPTLSPNPSPPAGSYSAIHNGCGGCNGAA